VLGCGLCGEKEPEHVDIEYLMEVILGDGLKRRTLVDARVVNEDVDAAVILDGCVDNALRAGCLRHVAMHSESLAAVFGDMSDDGVRARLAGGIIDDHRCAFSGERLGDGGSDAF